MNTASIPTKCPICNRPAKTDKELAKPPSTYVECAPCGKYTIDYPAAVSRRTTPSNEIYLLQAAVRYLSDRGRNVRITMENEADIIASFPMPHNVFDQLDLILKSVALPIREYKGAPLLEKGYFTVGCCKSEEEYNAILKLVSELNYTHRTSTDRFILTATGWKRLVELEQHPVRSTEVFVAMWFAGEMLRAWEDGFYPAINELGFEAKRVGLNTSNEKIDDEIIANIRESCAVVADATGERPNVYYEAGFAKGLGLPVIWTCRVDYESKLHFDTRQYPHILWENEADLKEKLQVRIRATIPVPK